MDVCSFTIFTMPTYNMATNDQHIINLQRTSYYLKCLLLGQLRFSLYRPSQFLRNPKNEILPINVRGNLNVKSNDSVM